MLWVYNIISIPAVKCKYARVNTKLNKTNQPQTKTSHAKRNRQPLFEGSRRVSLETLLSKPTAVRRQQVQSNPIMIPVRSPTPTTRVPSEQRQQQGARYKHVKYTRQDLSQRLRLRHRPTYQHAAIPQMTYGRQKQGHLWIQTTTRLQTIERFEVTTPTETGVMVDEDQ